MTQRLQKPSGSGRRRPRGRTPRSWTHGSSRGARTDSSVMTPVSEPTILGFPADVEDTGATARQVDGAEPEVSAPQEALTVLRRADAVGAGALVLAGVAANVSLLLSWSPGEGPTGLSLVQRGGEALDAGVAESVRSDVLEPLVVVLSGGLLVLLGFLLLVPARAHRLVGLLALVVALAATAAVLFVVSDVGWRTDRFGPGLWCAVAVPALGLLGALKAMLTAPRVTLDPAEPPRS
jgi:hypothetical protein